MAIPTGFIHLHQPDVIFLNFLLCTESTAMTPRPNAHSTTSPPADTGSGLHHILVMLRVSLHVTFAFLLSVALIQALAAREFSFTQPGTLGIVVFTALLAGIYLVGTTWENRSLASQAKLGSQLSSTTSSAPRRLTTVWLAAVSIVWVALVALSPSFVWLLFPLAFLYLHILPLGVSIFAVIFGWGVAGILPALTHPESWSLAHVIGPGIGSVFATAVYFLYRALGREIDHHAQIAQQLRAAQAELAESEHQAGRLEERERLSREIHDTVAQGLSSIVLLARAAQAQLSSGTTDAVAEQLKVIARQGQASLSEARRFVRDLASPDLGDPLPRALERIIDRAQERDTALGIARTFTLEVTGDANLVPEPVSRAIVRTVQEAISNIHKHSNATKAVITVSIWEDEVLIDVMDNGTLDTDTHNPNFGFGLSGMRQRIVDLNGTFAIEFGVHDHTSVSINCKIPLTSRRDD
ncbi:Sensor histidine kinase DesK [Corynebacterium felinum]|nr:Sensor histidine kinase DesK [Corynebacterium felinum]